MGEAITELGLESGKILLGRGVGGEKEEVGPLLKVTA